MPGFYTNVTVDVKVMVRGGPDARRRRGECCADAVVSVTCGIASEVGPGCRRWTTATARPGSRPAEGRGSGCQGAGEAAWNEGAAGSGAARGCQVATPTSWMITSGMVLESTGMMKRS